MDKYSNKSFNSSRFAANLTLFTLFVLPLIYAPGFGSFSALKYCIFGTISLILLVTTISTWLQTTSLYRSFIRGWYGYGIIVFIAGFLLVSFSSVDVAASFFSSFQRTDGAFTMLFLTIFTLNVFTLVMTVGKEFVYRMIQVSVIAAAILSILVLFSKEGIGSWFPEARGGATMGNSSLAAAYVLWNVFFALILIVRASDKKTRFAWMISLLFLVISPLFINWHFDSAKGILNLIGAARGAILGGIYGITIAACTWLMFQPDRSKRNAGAFALALILAGTIYIAVVFLDPESSLHKGFAETAKETRFFFWDIAMTGFQDRPVFGWGPSNYNIVYHKYYDPNMVVSKFGSEMWVDKTHNLIVESLVTGGVVLLSAWIMFITSIFAAILHAKSKGNLTNTEALILVGAIAGWLLQAQFVFDSISSFAMLFMLAGFVYALAQDPAQRTAIRPSKNHKMIIASVMTLSLAIFIYSILMPFQKNRLIYSTYRLNLPQRATIWQNFDKGSPMGTGYDSVLMLNNLHLGYLSRISEILKSNATTRDATINELENVSKYLYDFTRTKKYDYELTLLGAQFSHIKLGLDNESTGPAMERALILADETVSLSPTNPQSYWIAAKIKHLAGDRTTSKELMEQAYELAPTLSETHYLILELASLTDDEAYYQSSLQRALRDIPDFKPQPRT